MDCGNPGLLNSNPLRFITAEKLITNAGIPAFEQTAVVVDGSGMVLDICDAGSLDPLKIENYQGTLVPGFVNAHCHLELSFLKGKIREGLGLHSFILKVEKLKSKEQEEILAAIEIYDSNMFNNGIVATGDICNTNMSFNVKVSSPMYYHNFLEIYAFDPARAEVAFRNGLILADSLEEHKITNGVNYSISPHANYSASQKLLNLITNYSKSHPPLLSIHSLESEDENYFFKEGKGKLLERFKLWGVDTKHWQTPNCSSFKWMLPQIPTDRKLQLVHNTYVTPSEISWAEASHKNLYWCLCPNANLFIEKKLPPAMELLQAKSCITLGTDSLASNHDLSILSEMKTIRSNFPHIELHEIVRWSSLNGAKYLGIDAIFGTIENGKRPGLNILNENWTSVKKIA